MVDFDLQVTVKVKALTEQQAEERFLELMLAAKRLELTNDFDIVDWKFTEFVVYQD